MNSPDSPNHPASPSDSYFRSARLARHGVSDSPVVSEYWTCGYVVLRGLFSATEVADWSRECDRILQSPSVSPGNIRTPYRMNSGSHPERIDPVVDISPLFSGLVKDPRITRVVEEIFGGEALLFKDKLIFKAPGTEGYTMHQDQAWWQLCPADDILSVSIQIDGANADNGCVELFRGCHDRMLTPVGERMNFRGEDLARIDPACGSKIETEPGDVLIFHSLTPHQSATNTSDLFRRSLYLSYSAARSGDFYEAQMDQYKKYSKNEDLTYFK